MKRNRHTSAPSFFYLPESPGVCDRGRTYFRQGRVSLEKVEPAEIVASVRGTRVYTVELRADSQGGSAWCDCPYFTENDECKHIWALLLTLEKMGMAQSQDGGMRVHLEKLRAMKFLNRAERTKPAVAPDWEKKLKQVPVSAPAEVVQALDPVWPAGQVVLYAIESSAWISSGDLRVQVLVRRPRQDGTLGAPRPYSRRQRQFRNHIPDPVDRQLVGVLTDSSNQYYNSYADPMERALGPELLDLFLPLFAQTGRLHLTNPRDGFSLTEPYRMDTPEPWEFHLTIDRPNKLKYAVTGEFVRGQERMRLDEPQLILDSGWLFSRGLISRLAHFDGQGWIAQLRRDPNFMVPHADGERFLEPFLESIGRTPLSLPQELAFERKQAPPQPWIKIAAREERFRNSELTAEVSFDYAGERVKPEDARQSLYRAEQRLVIDRDPAREQALLATLTTLGFRTDSYAYYNAPRLLLKAKKLPQTVAQLLAVDWKVEADGKLFRPSSTFKISVRSGVDWFELHGTMDFDGATASLPALLEAARKGETTVLLDDGSLGMLPADWLKQWGVLAGAGQAQADHVRFRPNQAALLDALLAGQPEAGCDEMFARVREQLHRFEQVAPAAPPTSFQGTLRDYQREGLGWLQFLRGMQFGGCLADDMGLGKTVQVLALLESLRVEPAQSTGAGRGADDRRPSLAVVPRSGVFNWRLEAERFAPGLRVAEHIGTGRARQAPDFSNVDLVLTTYGTLRRDIAFLREIAFDTVILDEAQAIKNAGTAQAKAARLLNTRHRLALSGTPVENHLGELWSLLEFLNPGLLGSATVFQALTGDGQDLDGDGRALLARALRPFILRRTKGQVAKDLPPRTEQTLYCDLEGDQRKQYDELREHYRRALLEGVDAQGLKKSAIQVLEALLRLRQAACHPGLIDRGRGDESSAKLDALLPQLVEILDEDHKVLVFSQFTSFLAILKKRLDAQHLPYVYLDGRTRDRQRIVEQFQNDPNCKLFLISLKAGGLGLNLTAAEYVFLLDPWWNPAVEAQAIDRTHRIGQQRQVFAYRLIARDTVEEKVLELQKSKRALADAIITQDNSLIRNLTREDLALLLG